MFMYNVYSSPFNANQFYGMLQTFECMSVIISKVFIEKMN